MASIITGYSYDIFISYRQKDNKYDGWVTEFVDNLKKELESTFKEDISVYFDINPHDGLLETHDVDESLKEKLKCLIFIPIISRTYCDPNSFAWEHEFKVFVDQAAQDEFGLKVKLPNSNVASRVLPVQIHDLDKEDISQCESVLGSVLRGIEFIYKEAGIDKPLAPDDDEKRNLNKTKYRIQIVKVAHAIKEIMTALKGHEKVPEQLPQEVAKPALENKKTNRIKILAGSIFIMAVIVLGIFLILKLLNPKEELEKSIAVLPFVNLSNDPEQEYFSDGMVDAILDHLFKVGGLKVISRTSTMRFKNTKLSVKEIAHELQVATILEGSVQRAEDSVRITIQLIDAETDTHLWSDVFDGKISNVFAFQSNVAKAVANELKITLTSESNISMKGNVQSYNRIAYDFYLKGNDYWSRFDAVHALEMYSQAIKEDSLFVLAHAKRALMHMFIYWNQRAGWQEHKFLGLEDIEKARALSPDHIEVKLVEAVKYYWVYRDYERSLKILEDLKRAAPNMAELYFWSFAVLRRQGKLEESVHELTRVLEQDPFNARYMQNLIQTYSLLHQYDQVIDWSMRGMSLIPDFEDFKYYLFNGIIGKTGNLQLALAESDIRNENVLYDTYYYQKQYNNLIELILQVNDYTGSQHYFNPPVYRLALIHFLKGDQSLCKAYADSAVAFMREKVNQIPDDDRYYATLGKSLALSGHEEEAIAYGKKAVDLKPVTLDVYQGTIRRQELMEIYILTGMYNLALDEMEYLLDNPSWLSRGEILIDPLYDRLRNFSRFQEIINSVNF